MHLLACLLCEEAAALKEKQKEQTSSSLVNRPWRLCFILRKNKKREKRMRTILLNRKRQKYVHFSRHANRHNASQHHMCSTAIVSISTTLFDSNSKEQCTCGVSRKRSCIGLRCFILFY